MARVNDMLAGLLIEEMAETFGAPFKYKDRLTRTEAQELRAWAFQHPQLMKAYRDKSDPHHRTAQLYGRVIDHFAREHPQDATGEPAAWPTRGERPPAVGDNPLRTGDRAFFPVEAEAWLEWAQTRREYQDAYRDGAHPRHADIVGLTHHATTLALSAAAAPEAEAAAPAAPSEDTVKTATLEQRIAEARKAPGYLDRNHPDHAAAVERVSALVREGQQPSQAAPALPAPSTAGAPPLAQRIAEARKHPAYMDGRHPEHAAAVERVGALHREADASAPAAAANEGTTP